MNIIETYDLCKQYGNALRVAHLNLDVPEGHVYGFLGPNGAGKTTVFNLLTKVYQPTAGAIVLDGKDTHSMTTAQVNKAGIARTFQNIRLFGDLTVAEFAENVNFYRGYFDCGERWSLDENGEWAENQYENVVYFGGGDGPAPFTYTVEDGTLRAVHWAYTETAETIYGTGDENARVAYLALAAAQKGTSLFNIRSVVKQIGSNSWAGDADYSAAWKNVEMRYDARIEGEYYYSEGFFLSVQDDQPITVTLTFDARLAE